MELIESLATVVEERTREKLVRSPYIGIIIDESTDISTEKN